MDSRHLGNKFSKVHALTIRAPVLGRMAALVHRTVCALLINVAVMVTAELRTRSSKSRRTHLSVAPMVKSNVSIGMADSGRTVKTFRVISPHANGKTRALISLFPSIVLHTAQ